MCKPYSNKMLINPNAQLFITGACNTGCEEALSIKYNYQVYKKMEVATVDEVWLPFLMPGAGSFGKFIFSLISGLFKSKKVKAK